MNHAELADLLEQQRDGLLDAAMGERLRQHMAAHPDDARWWQRSHSFDVRVAQESQSYLDAATLPAAARDATRARLARRASSPWLLRGALVAALILVVLLGAPSALRAPAERTSNPPPAAPTLPLDRTATPVPAILAPMPTTMPIIGAYPAPAPALNLTRPTISPHLPPRATPTTSPLPGRVAR